MNDQAMRLRGLMEARLTMQPSGFNSSADGEDSETTAAKVIAVSSGKGGVGKSNIALNLSIALQRSGKSVCVIDANPGLANIDLLCGLNGYWNLSHVVSGARELADVLLEGPEGVHVLSGANALADLGEQSQAVDRELLSELQKLESQHDYLVLDTGAGTSRSTRRLVAAADVSLIVTTPEPTSIADAYANIKLSGGQSPNCLMAVVNQAASATQAETILDRLQRTAKLFLNRDIAAGGHVPADPGVSDSVLKRIPLLVAHPRSSASEALIKLAQRIRSKADGFQSRGSYFRRLSTARSQAAA